VSERDYIDGSEAQWRKVLQLADTHMIDGGKPRGKLLCELSEARADVRELLSEIGDNSLCSEFDNLADVIRKRVIPLVQRRG
jgi:hypothetical protein